MSVLREFAKQAATDAKNIGNGMAKDVCDVAEAFVRDLNPPKPSPEERIARALEKIADQED